jgi:hypothetical protein
MGLETQLSLADMQALAAILGSYLQGEQYDAWADKEAGEALDRRIAARARMTKIYRKLLRIIDGSFGHDN